MPATVLMWRYSSGNCARSAELVAAAAFSAQVYQERVLYLTTTEPLALSGLRETQALFAACGVAESDELPRVAV